MTALEIAMDKARLAQINIIDPVALGPVLKYGSTSYGAILVADTSEGMAQIFEDTPMSKPVAIVTVTFARKFCAEDPYYTWRKL